jgi:hypothetical protein
MAAVKVSRVVAPKAAMGAFQKQFGTKYQVYKPGLYAFREDFHIKNTGWAAIAVKVKQESNGTQFTFNPCISSVWYYLLYVFVVGIIAYAIIYPSVRPTVKEMEKEVESFIKSAPEFN